jgi:uncharacterized membrane protein
MSDTSQGEGWWQASDGKWYPPEQAPGGAGAATGAGMGAPAGGGGMQASSPGDFASVGEAFNYGWTKFQLNVGKLIVAALIGFGIVAVLTLIGYIAILGGVLATDTECRTNAAGFTTCDSSGPGFVMFLLGMAIFFGLVYFGQFLFDMLMIRVGLLVTAGEELDTSKVLSTDRLGPYLLGSLLMTLLVVVGFILCIIPGILVLLFGRFFGYYILDKGQAPVDAIKSSFNLVKDNFGKVFVFLLAVFAANWVGSIACYVGLLVTMPLTAIATAYFYKRFDGQPIAA